MDDAQIKEQVWNRVKAINQAWTQEGRIDELKKYFHQDMVAIVPSDSSRLEGQTKCLNNWQEFALSTKINYFEESKPLVQIYNQGKTAIVTYYYEGSFEMGGRTMILRGRDMMVLIKEKNQWYLVADHFSSMPKSR